tara:strand:+ start:920 stop:1345 length:426 start_codon:yes stop_codon:yes gene_type:complete
MVKKDVSGSGGNKKVEWALRLAVFGTFLGHGLFALSIKQSWFGYFTGVGIAESSIRTLLMLIGIMDIAVAGFALFKPIRGVLLWAVVWSVATALIRPITGDFFGLDFLDFVERASNFMAPLALILLYGWPKNASEWFSVRN